MTDFAPPGDEFARELREVAKMAQGLSGYIADANRLPDGFPALSVQKICQALNALPGGSAIEAVETLVYTRKRLHHFRPRPTQDEARETDDIARGEQLDAWMAKVDYAVGTAIGVYEETYGEDVPEPRIQEPPAHKTPENDFGADRVAHDADEAHAQTRALITKLREKGDDDATAAQIIRGLTDAEISLLLAAAELNLDAPKQYWLKKIGAGLVDGVENLGKLLEQVPSIGTPLVETWYDIKKEIWKSGLWAIGRVGTGLREVAENIKKAREDHAPDPQPPTPDPPFDSDEAHAMILAGTPLYESWKPLVTALYFVAEEHFTQENLNLVQGLGHVDKRFQPIFQGGEI